MPAWSICCATRPQQEKLDERETLLLKVELTYLKICSVIQSLRPRKLEASLMEYGRSSLHELETSVWEYGWEAWHDMSHVEERLLAYGKSGYK